jgi:peptide/nickel transport system ATP-binding protein
MMSEHVSSIGLEALPDVGGQAQPLLIVENLVKTFPVRGGLLNRRVASVHAVSDVSFSVRKQETLGIVGESGCGKSTLARLLMQLEPVDSGQFIFDGQPLDERVGMSLRTLRRNVQMVFQDSSSSFNPQMTMEEIVAYGPKVHGVESGKAREMARRALTQVGLNSATFARRYPHELSGGQKQRANIARALAIGPRMLILDESVSALDKSIGAQVLNLLRQLRRELGLTYVFISHDLNVVRYISDRVLVMYLGKVVELGDSDPLYARPLHPYTQALLRSRLSATDFGTPMVEPLPGELPSPLNPPSGCRFRTRCKFTETVCERKSPDLAQVAMPAGERWVACHLYRPDSGHSQVQAGQAMIAMGADA